MKFSGRNRIRSRLYFESSEQAEERTIRRKQREAKGKIKLKRHSPHPDTLQFEKDRMLVKARGMTPGQEVRPTYVFEWKTLVMALFLNIQIGFKLIITFLSYDKRLKKLSVLYNVTHD